MGRTVPLREAAAVGRTVSLREVTAVGRTVPLRVVTAVGRTAPLGEGAAPGVHVVDERPAQVAHGEARLDLGGALAAVAGRHRQGGDARGARLDRQ